jgi:hypothetical protein
MTSLIAWVGIDSRGQTSAYLASDSRISWGDSASWDTGRKLFVSASFPEIFGYCGDVIFPSQILSHIIEQIDNNLLLQKEDSIENKIKKIFHCIQTDFQDYPESLNKGFEILYFSRENCGMDTKFHLSKIKWNHHNKWQIKSIPLPRQSGLVNYTGSGVNSIYNWYRRWQHTEIKGTSRAVFSAFCDSITSNEDSFTGGAPQLVGLYRKGAGKRFGIIHDRKRYINGKLFERAENINTVEWRNCLFERCDGRSLEILPNAQRQPRPSRQMI